MKGLNSIRLPDGLPKAFIERWRTLTLQRMDAEAKEFSAARARGDERGADMALTRFVGLRKFLRQLEAKR